MGNPYAPPSGNAPRPPTPDPHPPGQPPHPVPGPPGPRPGEPDQVGRTVPRPDPEAARAASRRVLHFSLLLLAGVVTSALPLPWQAASLAFVVAALVVGIRALSAVWRAGLRGLLVPLLAIGLSFTALMSIALASLLALWPVQLERQRCLSSALTIAATQTCQADYQDALEDRLLELGRRGSGTGS